MPEGGPYTLAASCGAATATADDVWVGEVWLASGQSNMDMTVGNVGNEAASAELARDAGLRVIRIPRDTFGGGRQAEVEAAWAVVDEDTSDDFSAVATHFAKELAAATGLKIGVVDAARGGTVIETWTSRETLVRNPALTAILTRHEADCADPALPRPPDPALHLPADPGNEGVKRGWADPGFDDSAWGSMSLPGSWNSQGQDFCGVFWFRKTVDVPKRWAGEDLLLCLGAADKHDVSYFNGEQIGATGSGFDQSVWSTQRRYRVPGRLVKPGRNVVTVRVRSFLYDGGLIGPDFKMRLKGPGAALPLQGEWKFAVEHNYGVVKDPPRCSGFDPCDPNQPHLLFDNMIAPLLPYAIRGALWYQGESNAAAGTAAYLKLLTDLVRDWRFAWGQGDFPFYIVQLANYRPGAGFPEIREAQRLALTEPNTRLAVTIDIGESEDIHPHDKREAGRRLALLALADVHGRELQCSPLLRSTTIEGSSVALDFDHGPLAVRGGGAARGFEIAGTDREFVPAQAVIEGSRVRVSSPACPRPTFVRYAWAADPADANLVNQLSLPASPFR